MSSDLHGLNKDDSPIVLTLLLAPQQVPHVMASRTGGMWNLTGLTNYEANWSLVTTQQSGNMHQVMQQTEYTVAPCISGLVTQNKLKSNFSDSEWYWLTSNTSFHDIEIWDASLNPYFWHYYNESWILWIIRRELELFFALPIICPFHILRIWLFP